MLTEDNCSVARELRRLLITAEMRDHIANGYVANGLSYPEFQRRWIRVLDDNNNNNQNEILTTYSVDLLLTWCVYRENSPQTTTFLPTKELFKGLKQHIIKTRSFRDISNMSKLLDDLHNLIQMTDVCLPFLSKFEKTFLSAVKRMVKLRKSPNVMNEAQRHYQSVVLKQQQQQHQLQQMSSSSQYFDQGLQQLAILMTEKRNRSSLLQDFNDSFIRGYIVWQQNKKKSSDLEKVVEQMIHLARPGVQVTKIIYHVYSIVNDPSDDESETVALLAILTIVGTLFHQASKRTTIKKDGSLSTYTRKKQR